MAEPIKVSNWMQALSDYMIANPESRAYEAARFFQVTEAWLSTVKNSDAFRQFHDKRRKEHFGQISTDVGEKLQALAEISLDEITVRVEEQRDEMSLEGLQKIGEMSLKALGFGGGRGGITINNNEDNRSVIYADAAALKRAQGYLKDARERNDLEIIGERKQEVQSG